MRGRIFQSLFVAIAVAVWCGSFAGSAAAKSEVFYFSNSPSSSQAGSHPNIVTAVEPGTRFNQPPMPECECDDEKDITTHAPAGVIANPHVVSECSAAELATFSCPADSQLGVVVLRFFGFVVTPLYRTTPQAGQAGLFAFLAPVGGSIPQYIVASARTGTDFGLDLKVKGIEHVLPPSYIGIVTWGVPGLSAHDSLRFAQGEKAFGCSTNPLQAIAEDKLPGDCEPKPPHSTSLPVEPLVQAPTTCAGPLSSKVEILAYDGETTSAEAPWPETTGCDKLSFNPSLAAAPTTTETDSPSGLAVDIKVPQFQDPNTPSPSELRASTVTLPEGFTLNAGAADGKTSCADAEANFGNEEAAECPEFSKVGTVELDSSALPGPIYGYIYLGEPKPGDRYRIFVTASGFGTNVKYAGSVRPDPNTGRLVTAFESLPQAPFQEFNLHFFGSERGLLATPTQCGTYEVKTVFKPWAGELSDQTSTQFFQIESGPQGQACPNGPRPFSPSLEAGVQDNTAGIHSPFVLQLTRADGEQSMSALAVKTPPGFSASLRGIPYCPEEAIESVRSPLHTALSEQTFPVCPAASQIGTAIAGAGAGTHPLYVGGKVYLAGPYKGAPLSLVVVIPALSGPYDLGTVAVRAAIQVDPETAQVTTVSDPLPQILEGVPLRTRFIRVSLDRPGFALNPTDCEPFSISSQVSGTEGALSEPSAHFQVANCANLGFAPTLSLRFSGQKRIAGDPAITATLFPREGDANFKGTRVVLPRVLQIDNEHIGSPCTRVQFAANACPPSSVLGHATATSPLLDQPLTGPVYMATDPGRELPAVLADLRGRLHIVLVGHTDQVKGGIRSTFEGLPDVPVSSFTLSLEGGQRGLLQNSEGLCAKAQKAKVSFTGQNGKATSSATKVAVAGCKKKHRHPRHRRHHKARRAGR